MSWEKDLHASTFSKWGRLTVKTTFVVAIIAFLLPKLVYFFHLRLIDHFEKFNPDALATTCELAQSRGYLCETHETVTSDGYILAVHRMSNKSFQTKIRRPILLMHGCECDSAVWVQNLANQSLGYILADAGLDIWMGNVRGTQYSHSHLKYTQDDPEFWDYSFEDHALKDLPAIIKLVKETTGYKVIDYVGHSQGSVISLVYLSSFPKSETGIGRAYLISPVYTLQDVQSSFKHVLKFSMTSLGRFLIGEGKSRVLHGPPNWGAVYMCYYPFPTAYICDYTWDFISGPLKHESRNESQMIAYFAHGLSGTTYKNVLHFAQLHVNNKFARFDYGDKNHEIYASESPPEIDLRKIQTPISLFHGAADHLVSTTDLRTLKRLLGSNLVYDLECPGLGHNDMIWGLEVAPCAYVKIRDLVLNE